MVEGSGRQAIFARLEDGDGGGVGSSSRPYRRRRHVSISSSPYSAPPSQRVSSREHEEGEEDQTSWAHDRYDGNSNAPASAVFVRGLLRSVSEEALRNLFESVSGCVVTTVKLDRAPLTTAVVGFKSRDGARKAVETFHQKVFMGEPIRVAITELDFPSAEDRDRARLQELKEREAMRQELQQFRRRNQSGRTVRTTGAPIVDEPVQERWSNDQKLTMAAMEGRKRSVFDRVN